MSAEEKPTVEKAVLEFISSMPEPGNIITEAWKRKNFGIQCPDIGTQAQMNKYNLEMLSAFKKFEDILLKENRIHLRPYGRGSHIMIHPTEQTRDAWESGVVEIGKTMGKMRKRLVNVAVEALTQDKRKENTDAQARLAQMGSMFRKAKKF